MRVSITERHVDVPKKVLERTRTQVEKLAKYEQRATSADFVFSEEKHLRKAEVIIHIDGAAPVVVRGEGTDFRSALDQLVDRARRILSEQRERRRDHKAPPLSDGVQPE